MAETVFTNFLDSVDHVVNGFLIDGYSRLRDACLTPLRLCLTIYVAMYGVLMLTGRAQLSYREVMSKLGVMLLVYVLATSADVYTGVLERLFVSSPAAIANVVVGGGGATGQNAAMDNFYNAGMDVGNKIWDRGHVAGPWSPFVAALVVYALTLGVAAYAAFLLALAKVALAILLILTPLFALLYLFGGTRRLFEGWLSQVIHYALIPILVYGVLGLILSIAQADLAALDANSDFATMKQVLNLGFVGIVAILLLAQVMWIAEGIAGGVTLSTMGAFQGAVDRGRGLSSAGTRWAWERYQRRQASGKTPQSVQPRGTG